MSPDSEDGLDENKTFKDMSEQDEQIGEQTGHDCSCVGCPITPEGVASVCVCSGLCLGLGEGIGFKVSYNDFLACEVVSLEVLRTMEILAANGHFDLLLESTLEPTKIPSTMTTSTTATTSKVTTVTSTSKIIGNNEKVHDEHGNKFPHLGYACNYRVTATTFKEENAQEKHFKDVYNINSTSEDDELVDNNSHGMEEQEIIVSENNYCNIEDDNGSLSIYSDSASAGDLSDTNESSTDSCNPFRNNVTPSSPNNKSNLTNSTENNNTNNNNNNNNINTNNSNKLFNLTAMNLHYMELRNLCMEMQGKEEKNNCTH